MGANLQARSGRRYLRRAFHTGHKYAHAQTGQQVVLLVDGYDRPMLNSISDDALLARNQDTLQCFHGALKVSAPRLRFVFLTGATRFAHVNVLSGQNTLEDISIDARFATLYGITKAKLQADLAEGAARMATPRASWRCWPRSSGCPTTR